MTDEKAKEPEGWVDQALAIIDDEKDLPRCSADAQTAVPEVRQRRSAGNRKHLTGRELNHIREAEKVAKARGEAEDRARSGY